MKRVSIVVLNWNGADMTATCLQSLEKLATGDFSFSVTVVDNGSNREDVSKLKSLNIKNYSLEIVENSVNLGYAGGNNVGIKKALREKADYVMVLNNDTTVDGNLLKPFVKAAEKKKDDGVFSPKIYFAKGFEFHKNRYKKSDMGKVVWAVGGEIDWRNVYGTNIGVDQVDRGQFNRMKSVDFSPGTCVFAHRRVFEEVGLFDERYYLYLEDVELSVRAKRLGYEVFYVPEAVVWHKVAQSSEIGGALNDYFITRNRLLFGMEYAPLRAKLALLRESLAFLKSGRPWQRTGVKDFYLRKFGRGSWEDGKK